MRPHTTCVLSTEEAAQLYRAQWLGGVSARIYTDGAFSEDEFIIFGVLQRLAIRGLLDYVGLTVDDRTMSYGFAPAHQNQRPLEPMDHKQMLAA